MSARTDLLTAAHALRDGTTNPTRAVRELAAWMEQRAESATMAAWELCGLTGIEGLAESKYRLELAVARALLDSQP